MKALFRAVTVAAAMALPMSLQAQIDPSVSVNLTSHPRQTTGTGYAANLLGGGFLANFTVDFPQGAQSLTNHLVWCIDWTRGVPVPGTTNFQLWSLADFANTTFGANGNDPDINDMQAIASQAALLEDDWFVLNATQRQNAQGIIWDRFSQANATGGNESFNGSSWYVLWNGQNQTLITRIPPPVIVPEPAALALLGAGFVGLLAVRRRRA